MSVNKISVYLEKKGMSERQFAADLGMHAQQINRYARGINQPSRKVWLRIKEVYKDFDDVVEPKTVVTTKNNTFDNMLNEALELALKSEKQLNEALKLTVNAQKETISSLKSQIQQLLKEKETN